MRDHSKKRGTKDQTSTKQDQRKRKVPAKTIYSTTNCLNGGRRGIVTFCVGWNVDVLDVEHSPKQLKLFTDVNYQIRRQFTRVEAQIIVTVSAQCSE